MFTENVTEMNDNKTIAELLHKISFENEEFLSRDETWDQIRKAIQVKRHRGRLFIGWRAAAAAVIVICTALGFGAQVHVESKDEVRLVELPDGSSVEMAARSTIRYNRIGWLFARDVRLKGDAAFSVNKGGRFSVETDVGSVSVLGTRFSVVQSEGRMEVTCHEGSVKIRMNTQSEVLHPGERADCFRSGIVLSKIPQSLPEYLEYDNIPLEEIVPKIGSMSGLDVVGLQRCAGVRFTGFIPTSDLREATEVLFGCCGVDYALNGSRLTLNGFKP